MNRNFKIMSPRRYLPRNAFTAVIVVSILVTLSLITLAFTPTNGVLAVIGKVLLIAAVVGDIAYLLYAAGLAQYNYDQHNEVGRDDDDSDDCPDEVDPSEDSDEDDDDAEADVEHEDIARS